MNANAALLTAESSALDLSIAPANDVDSGRPQLRLMPRWRLRASLDATTSEDCVYAGLSYDVTVGGGVFVATYDTPIVGARVDLTLSLPDGSEHEVTGVVRFVREAQLASEGLPAGCGVECKGLPLEAQRAIVAFADAREPMLWLPEAA
jgi:hypothetical protein